MLVLQAHSTQHKMLASKRGEKYNYFTFLINEILGLLITQKQLGGDFSKLKLRLYSVSENTVIQQTWSFNLPRTGLPIISFYFMLQRRAGQMEVKY